MWQQHHGVLKCMHNILHYEKKKKTLSGLLIGCHFWFLLIFCTTQLRGEEELWSRSLSKSIWTLDNKVGSTCAKLCRGQVCLCAFESQDQLTFWSSAHVLCISLSHSVDFFASIWLPVAVRLCGVRGDAQWLGWNSGIKGRRMEEEEANWEEVSVISLQQWNARSLLHVLFWEVSLLAGVLLKSLDYYQIVESTLVVW